VLFKLETLKVCVAWLEEIFVPDDHFRVAIKV